MLLTDGPFFFLTGSEAAGLKWTVFPGGSPNALVPRGEQHIAAMLFWASCTAQVERTALSIASFRHAHVYCASHIVLGSKDIWGIRVLSVDFDPRLEGGATNGSLMVASSRSATSPHG